MMPIGLLTIGEKANVLAIGSKAVHRCSCGKGGHVICTRIEDMGLRSGQTVEMLSNDGKGPILLKVDNSRIAIGRGMAMKIMVEAVRR
ncbi:MAG: ferrous iron transport protein A [Firmicutes bacterium]|nr:ferrous iron transport protein A [Bacillota bacterium]